jgi:hypothetical protein
MTPAEKEKKVNYNKQTNKQKQPNKQKNSKIGYRLLT